MSQNLIIAAVDKVGGLSGIEPVDLIEKITLWNKEKAYPVTPIHINIDENGVTDNSDEIGELVGKIGEYVEDVEKNYLDAQSVEEAKKTVLEIGKFLTETRKIQTSPLAKITGNYTQHESKFKEFNDKLASKIDAIKEKEYQVNEKAIRDYFMDEIMEQDLQGTIGLEMFKDFIENKRKTKIFNAKGESLTKGIKDAIKEAIRIAYEPIKAAKELDERKQQQSKQFELYLENTDAEGETEVLRANIIALERFKEQVKDLYPDIVESCIRSIDNKIGRCNANIRANEAVAQKEAIQNADGEFMERVNEINRLSNDMMIDVGTLKEYHKELQSIYPKLTYSENQEKVKSIGTAIKTRISDMEKVEVEQVSEPVHTNEEKEHVETKKYMISINDLEPLAYAQIEAENEEEAKRKFVERFEMHLSMVALSEVEK